MTTPTPSTLPQATPSRRRVVVTGMGMVTPCGIGVEATWDALVHGRGGIAPITLFDASMMETRFAGEVKGFVPEDFMDRKQARRVDRYQQFALAAAEMAMRDARYSVADDDATRAAVVVGTCVAGLASSEQAFLKAHPLSPGTVSPFFILAILGNMAASYLSIRYGFKGPSWSLGSACSTSAHALGEACHLIRRGDADVVLAGGTESPICFMGVAAFNAIRALSTRNDAPERASRPFDVDRDGFVLSEGAGVLVVEELDHARARGARIYAELAGYGACSDAFHITAPAPEHEGAQRCMRLALADAGMGPADIGYINAHGTSTPVGDTAEIAAIAEVFGAHARAIPISSTKSMTGHMTGAAGSTEAIISVLAMERGVIPPTTNLDTLDPAIDLDCVPNVARPATLDAVMTNSFGFGGTNASLIFRKIAE
jgi:3-oxoacyl-[acyl-carrier-protein] synthase II